MDSLPNPKELIKLAKACRKAGISHFKGFGFEFTLTNELPSTKLTKAAISNPNASNSEPDQVITPDTPTEEELLFWSSGGNTNQDEATEN